MRTVNNIFAAKTEADRLNSLEIWWLNKNRYLDGYKKGEVEFRYGWTAANRISIVASLVDENEPYIQFIYTRTDNQTGEKRDLNYKVLLATTPCNFGGKRYWFICPMFRRGAYCGRRVGVMYRDGDFFACRHCHDLTYGSRNVALGHRSLWRIFDIEEKANDLHSSIKRYTYRGKPTKKVLRFKKLRHAAITGVASLDYQRVL